MRKYSISDALRFSLEQIKFFFATFAKNFALFAVKKTLTQRTRRRNAKIAKGKTKCGINNYRLVNVYPAFNGSEFSPKSYTPQADFNFSTLVISPFFISKTSTQLPS